MQFIFYLGVNNLYSVRVLINIDETSIHITTYLFYATRLQVWLKPTILIQMFPTEQFQCSMKWE